MLTREELNQINELKLSNPLFQRLFDKVEQEHQYTLSQISHRIRNDLTPMMSSFQFIEYYHPEVHGFKYWKENKNGIIYIRDFLEQISDFYKGSRVNFLSFNLDRMLTDLVHSTQSESYSIPASITLEIIDSCPELYGDSAKLYHALELLIRNSYEAIPENTGSISLTLSRENSFHKISIYDNGSGFSEEMRDRLWIPFSSDKQHHSGLGLCIANRIILSHGGYMELAQSLPGDTCFHIYLPAGQASGEYEQLIQQAD